MNPTSVSMILSTSPRKAVPLASGDDWQKLGSPSKAPSLTRRAFFCGVVVESEEGNAISEGQLTRLYGSACQYNIQLEVQELVASLGDPLASYSNNDTVQSSSLERDDNDNAVSTRTRSYSPFWVASATA